MSYELAMLILAMFAAFAVAAIMIVRGAMFTYWTPGDDDEHDS